MPRFVLPLLAAALILAALPAFAQPNSCRQEMLRGTWSFTCSGFTDLSKVNPALAAGTMGPFSMLGRGTLSLEGKGGGKGFASLGGTVIPFEAEESYAINADCTAEKTYVLRNKALGLTVPGKAATVIMPDGSEFSMLILTQGDAVTCQYKRMSRADY